MKCLSIANKNNAPLSTVISYSTPYSYANSCNSLYNNGIVTGIRYVLQ